MDCMQLVEDNSKSIFPRFNTASGMDCMQFVEVWQTEPTFAFQYRKRYGLHAIRLRPLERNDRFLFQYRKRYGLHAITNRCNLQSVALRVSIPQAVWIACNFKRNLQYIKQLCFNTASGMDCMQCCGPENSLQGVRFNTASGMDCMQ